MYFAPEVQLALFRCGLVAREAAAYRQALIALEEQPFTLVRAPEPQRRYLREARLVTPEGHTAVEAALIVRLSPEPSC